MPSAAIGDSVNQFMTGVAMPDDNRDPRRVSAVSSFEHTVAELTRLRGWDHPETLRCRAQLARRRHQMGDLRRAIRDYESLLPDLVRALGGERAGTLDFGTPVVDHAEVGHARGAITHYERRVQDLLNRLGATFSPLL
jgi:hypothetical protein